VLTFCGTDSDSFQDAASDWMTNLKAWSTKFCGFDGVHSGFVGELKRIVGSQEYMSNIKPKLGGCAKVFTAGHSLGGAVAELFTACANREMQHPDLEEWRHIKWQGGQPTSRTKRGVGWHGCS